MKLLVIGLDGVDFSIVQQLIERNRLANMRFLGDTGSWGLLKSTIPPVTPTAWLSLASGVNPGKHGVYGFVAVHRTVDGMRLSTPCKSSVPKLWDILAGAGWRVGILNFPSYFPPDPIQPFFVSGFGSPGGVEIAFPSNVWSVLGDSYQIQPLVRADEDPLGFREEVSRITQRCVEIAIRLMRTYELDVFWVTLMAADWIQHYFWNDDQTIEAVYDQLDKAIGLFLSEVREDEAYVLVVSDHGARRIKGEIRLNVLLQQWGYLQLKGGISKARERVYRKTLALGRLLQRLCIPARTLLPSRWIDQVQQFRPSLVEWVDWPKTAACSIGYLGDIWLNPGVCDVAELATELKAKLREVRNPITGEKLVQNVYERCEIYSGAYSDAAPDLIAVPTNYEYLFNCWELGSGDWFSVAPAKVADHSPNGIFFLRGPGVRSANFLGELSILDVLPTILYSLGLPIPTHVDGQIVIDAFAKARLSSQKPRYADYVLGEGKATEVLNEWEESEILNRLRRLGYVE